MEGLAVRDAGERAQVLLEVASARRAQGHLLPSRGLLVLSFEAGRYDVGGGKGTRLLQCSGAAPFQFQPNLRRC